MSENARASSVSSAAAEKLLHPVDTVATTVSHVPGATTVKDAFDTVLDTVGIVSPRSRRIAAYAGVGLLGAAGAVEWPVAAAGAAVVWLTQSRPTRAGEGGAAKAGVRTAAGTTRRSASRSSPKGRATAKPRAAKKAAAAKTTKTKATKTSSAGG
ncbi:hypothetical protein [Streptomyces brasiliensis]|uniref:Uncharacterized protein n=1 Tax=Streptomyces brasiliensis TaxID=1954 RepID=A0A917UN70_9ACTN|nr:hypothetical protein [Streptomyces brasiliensis]GGJ69307.1 hypothetical protein GCM10010121_095050 [Streptomyces brasiliensis]